MHFAQLGRSFDCCAGGGIIVIISKAIMNGLFLHFQKANNQHSSLEKTDKEETIGKMQLNHNWQGESSDYLSWTYEYKSEDQGSGEDAKARKRRLQAELSRALAVLGIKPSTFHSLVNRRQTEEVKELIDVSIKERTSDIVKSKAVNRWRTKVKPEKKEYNIDLEVTDMSTVHEAYQFLVKKFVDSEDGFKEGLVSGVGIDLQEMKKRRQEKKNASKDVEMEALNQPSSSSR